MLINQSTIFRQYDEMLLVLLRSQANNKSKVHNFLHSVSPDHMNLYLSLPSSLFPTQFLGH